MACLKIGEMVILHPNSGGIYALAARISDLAWGFATAVLPLEITAAGIIVSYWTNNVSVSVGTTIFLAIVLISIFGTIGSSRSALSPLYVCHQ
ncbi:hypothetical protein CPB86DRAFT_837552 [Serendipita vermifera]|nr:hypothetical protein CPB86DRAFT_837552 [Serendipita vermifera]